MRKTGESMRRGSVGLVALAVLGAASVLRAQPAAVPPAGARPLQAPALPSASTSSVLEAKVPPPATGEQRFEAALAARPGGLRSDDVARKAEMTSPEVLSKMKAVEGAAAKVDQAAVNFAPRLSLQARYVRLSRVTYPSLGSGYIVGTDQQGPLQVYCPAPGQLPGLPVDQPIQCQARAAGAPFTFPAPPTDMYALQGTIAVPISDYVLRISQNYASAIKSHSAAVLQERATRAKVQRDARVAYYNWIRARGGVVVAEQGLATVRAHLKDVNAAVLVGSASKADYMRVESQVASVELLLERTRNLTSLVEEQLRVMMHDAPETRYEIGEEGFSDLPPAGPMNLGALQAEAMEKRLEIRALDDTVYSLREAKRVVQAGYLPRLDGFANLYYQNPNTRIFPQTPEWRMTWDVGAQLSWTINDTFSATGQVAEIQAKTQEIEAQKNMLRDGLLLEVTQAYNAVREADVALETTGRQRAAAEESYRVRRELFRAGRATSVELTDAENDLMRSRLDALNARMDARVARANLDHALGRDAAHVR